MLRWAGLFANCLIPVIIHNMALSPAAGAFGAEPDDDLSAKDNPSALRSLISVYTHPWTIHSIFFGGTVAAGLVNVAFYGTMTRVTSIRDSHAHRCTCVTVVVVGIRQLR